MQDAMATSDHDSDLGRLRAAIAAAGDVIYEWDLVSDRIHWSGQITELLGLPSDAQSVCGDDLLGRIHPEDLPRRQVAMLDHFSNREPFDCEYRIRRPNGDFLWVHDRGYAELSQSGQPLKMVGVLRVVTRLKQNEARLEYLASFDELTGHFNRNRLREELDHTLTYASRYRIPGAYLTLGIDKLSLINNAYGYSTADGIIVAVGRCLEEALRASDVIGRVGDDRFGVVLGSCPVEQLPSAAEKILQTVRRAPMQTPNGVIHVTASIGAIAFPDCAGTAYEAMARADVALQDAKDNGRNCYVLYKPSEVQRQTHRLDVQTCESVRQALTEDRIVFAYQPIVDTSTNEVDHYECLVRMLGDDGKIITAGQFIPSVEKLGLIRQLDRHTLSMALNELSHFPSIKLAVNISGITPTDRTWMRMLLARLKDSPEIAERLTLEITETMALRDLDESRSFVRTLRGLGCHVSLDDFGAGYTSFRLLKTLDVDGVKIDGSFVRHVAENGDNLLFIRTLHELADGFGLRTVAESVENQADLDVLRHHGITRMQGFHFGHPSIERQWLAPDNVEFLPAVKLAKLSA